MTRGAGDNNASNEAGRDVGYGKPPAQHRFRKGTSGNPNGRPPKPREYEPMLTNSLEAAVMMEGERRLMVNADGRPTLLPALTVIARGLARAAASGDARAQASFTRIHAAASKAETNRAHTTLTAVHRYRAKVRAFLAVEPNQAKHLHYLLPHPDEIAENMDTGEILFNGPKDYREHRLWNDLNEIGNTATALIDECRWQKVQRPGPEKAAALDEIIKAEELGALLISCVLPDLKTRRGPTFNLSSWRRSQRYYPAVLRIFRREKRGQSLKLGTQNVSPSIVLPYFKSALVEDLRRLHLDRTRHRDRLILEVLLLGPDVNAYSKDKPKSATSVRPEARLQPALLYIEHVESRRRNNGGGSDIDDMTEEEVDKELARLGSSPRKVG